MALKATHIIKYEIDTPGFEGVEFTESSKDHLICPEAVEFAADRNSVLQSLREAAAFRIEAEGKEYHADRNQPTRTGAIYFKNGNKFYVAFDDTPDPQQNIILARVRGVVRGVYDANSNDCAWTLSKKDEHISQILKRAEKSDRIVEVVESALELATKANGGVSEFGSNKIVQALFGDVAEPYAAMLKSRTAMLKSSKYDKGSVYFMTPEMLGETVDEKNAVVRYVGLCHGKYDRISGVCASCQFNYFGYAGYARGVRRAREFSRITNLAELTK